MPETEFDPDIHRPVQRKRGESQLRTASELGSFKLHPPVSGEYLWQKTKQIVPDGHVEFLRGRVHDKWVCYVRGNKQFVRPYTPPGDPRTGYQLDQRGRMAQVLREWPQVSRANRLGWIRMAEFLLPEQYRKSPGRAGQNLFASAQMQRVAWGDTFRHEPPRPPYGNEGWTHEVMAMQTAMVRPSPVISIEEEAVPDGAGLALCIGHAQLQLRGCRLLIEMTPATRSLRQKPVERRLTRAGLTDAGSFFPLGESGAVYLLETPRHQVKAGERFAVRVSILTEDGIRGSARMVDLIRK